MLLINVGKKSKNMKYRKIPIILTNLFFLFLIAKVYYFDEQCGTNGVFALGVFVVLVFFNSYAVCLYSALENKHGVVYEILYYIFIVILPIILLCYSIYVT